MVDETAVTVVGLIVLVGSEVSTCSIADMRGHS